jgi:hypothetical protein
MIGARILTVAAVGIVCAVILLSSLKISSTPVDLDAESQTLSFTAAEAGELSPFAIGSVVFYGSGQADIGGTITPFRSNFSVTKADASQPLMTMRGLTLEAGTAVKIRKRPDTEKSFDLEVRGGGARQFLLLAQGQLQIEADGASHTVQAQIPQSIRVSEQDGPARFALVLAEREWSEKRPVHASALSFFDGGEKDGVPYAFSTLDSGHVRFSEIELDDGKNKELDLRAGQPFFVKPKQAGGIRLLKLSAAGINVRYSGEVASLGTGWTEQDPTSHMPSWLVFLASKDWVKQAASALLAAYGLYFAYWQARTARSQR